MGHGIHHQQTTIWEIFFYFFPSISSRSKVIFKVWPWAVSLIVPYDMWSCQTSWKCWLWAEISTNSWKMWPFQSALVVNKKQRQHNLMKGSEYEVNVAGDVGILPPQEWEQKRFFSGWYLLDSHDLVSGDVASCLSEIMKNLRPSRLPQPFQKLRLYQGAVLIIVESCLQYLLCDA